MCSARCVLAAAFALCVTNAPAGAAQSHAQAPAQSPAQAPAESPAETPSQISAQVPPSPVQVSVERIDLDRLRARLDTLDREAYRVHLADSLRREAEHRAYMEHVMERYDTATFGPMRVTGLPRMLGEVEPVFTEGWRTMKPLFAGMEDALDSALFHVGGNAYDGPFVNMDRTTPKNFGVMMPRTADPDMWRTAVEGALGALLMTRLPASVRRWMGRGVIGLELDAQATFRTLVIPPPFDPSDDRGLRCSAGDIAACRSLLDMTPDGEFRGGGPIRTSFLSHVLRRSPAGAVAASTADTSGVERAIENLAGAEIDTLVAGWLTELKQERRRGFAGTGRNAPTTALWVAAFAAVALRSTRWRIG